MAHRKSYTYADSGVSIAAGNAFVKAIAPFVAKTSRPGADAELGGFGALFDLRAAGFKDPLLVAATDGVGTKLRIAIDSNKHDGVGIDLVAMCVNDLVVQGAEPLFFLDYFATGKLDTSVAATVVNGIAEGCRIAGCSLVGGETAEMPGMYDEGDYDLAGFAVGAVDRKHQLTGSRVVPGDIILGLASSGFHSNGFSLIRRVIHDKHISLHRPAPFDISKNLDDILLTPTRIYVNSLIPDVRARRIKALAHITGGGLLENIPRVLPKGARARIIIGDLLEDVPDALPKRVRAIVDATAWTLPPAFKWLQAEGNISPEEMARTFNCGVGMVAVVAAKDVQEVVSSLTSSGETVHVIGAIEEGKAGCTVVGAANRWNSNDKWEATHDA